ncbi:Type-1V conjugative transfer system mating pair stabilisation [Azotobacter beijerinckii]|uniref:Type-1V conjugative transfer system mating pair stabilisation n=2 Tax=Azotobacter beijerinckii TaxID=170623 RepID=A0A1I4I2R4_9GAMM|nr:Type-1V conjugative transfer system mating pair stabilisation [Azotobacter beijerinckii]
MQLTSQAAAVVNFVGFVYTAYVVTDMMIKIIWECEKKEFELGAKKETRQCAYVGSYCASKVLGTCVEKREAYCCFSSVVGRIIQEQGRPQLGLDFGDPENPVCEALTVEQLGRIDWSRIDLSEWIGMLYTTGHLDTPDTATLENLTGSGSSLGNVFDNSTRANTLNRNIERLDGVDVDQIKSQAEQEIKGNIFQ